MTQQTDEVRFWPRLGIYITREFAEEYIERSQDTGITGEYLDDELEEYNQVTTVSPLTLRREVEEIFSKPFEEVELPDETKALFKLMEMENNRKKILLDYKSQGMTIEEAKEQYAKDVDAIASEALGIDLAGDNESEDSPHEEE